MHGVVEEMDRRGKSESAAISSAIDMGESETVGPSFGLSACQRRQHGSSHTCDTSAPNTLLQPGTLFTFTSPRKKKKNLST